MGMPLVQQTQEEADPAQKCPCRQVTFSEAGGAVVGVASSSPLEMPPVIEDAYFYMSCVSCLVDALNMSKCFPPL